jgi:repressor LexA
MNQAYTERQGQYLAYLHQFSILNGCAPSEADMQRFFQVTPPTVHQMVLTLERRGFILRVSGQARSITLAVPPESLPPLRRSQDRASKQEIGCHHSAMRTSAPEKLLKVVDEIDAHSQASLTRLTLLKKWFARPERLSAFALWAAARAVSRKGKIGGLRAAASRLVVAANPRLQQKRS